MTRPYDIDANTLLERSNADLSIHACAISLALLYVSFSLFALIALKINSRRV